MSPFQNIVEQIDRLDPVEREKLVLALSRSIVSENSEMTPSSVSLSNRESSLIVSTPGVCGGAARLIRTRIPVWTIESMRRLGCSDLEILRSYPTLRAEDLVEARRYSAQHREEIEQAIRENEEE